MTSRDLFELEHGDTGVALLVAPAPLAEACKVNGQGASVPHSDRDKSEQPTAEPTVTTPAMQPDQRIKKLVSLSRWERAGMLAYVAATFPDAFDEAFEALGLGS